MAFKKKETKKEEPEIDPRAPILMPGLSVTRWEPEAATPKEPVHGVASVEGPKRKLNVKLADLDWEIAKQPDSGNFRIFKEDGTSQPLSDINTILLWEILRALRAK